MNHWIIFGIIVSIMLFLDLCYFNRKNKKPDFKKNLLISALYIMVSLCFGIWIYCSVGSAAAQAFITAYALEKTLSIDNVFVISAIFTYLKIEPEHQRRVLFWGLAGVIIFRAIMITLGLDLISRFEFILYIFGIILIFTGIKMLFATETKMKFKENIVIKFMHKFFNISDKVSGESFYIYQKGKIYFTKLTVALILIEFMDLIFAIDSIPVVFAITQDQYIIYTSNIFAIIGLRSLYTCLSIAKTKFHYLKHALSVILVLIGIKILLKEHIAIPSAVILITTISTIAIGIITSIYSNKPKLARGNI